jgi:hypothetical protein
MTAFFTVVFHELMDVLGFLSDLIPRWRDKSTGKRYPTSIQTFYKSQKFGKTSKILHTLSIRGFMTERVGLSEFPPGVPIDDGGGAGTAGSHPEARVYAGESVHERA